MQSRRFQTHQRTMANQRDPDKVSFSMWIPSKLRDAIKELSAEDHRTMANYVETLLLDHCREKLGRRGHPDWTQKSP